MGVCFPGYNFGKRFFKIARTLTKRLKYLGYGRKKKQKQNWKREKDDPIIWCHPIGERDEIFILENVTDMVNLTS